MFFADSDRIEFGQRLGDVFDAMQPLDSKAQPIDGDIARLVQAIELVLAQRGLSAERRLGAVARQIALVWLTENTTTSDAASLRV